jgi:hypothetical protein
MATTLGDCFKTEAAIKEAGTIFGMGHGLFIYFLSYHGRASAYIEYLVLRYSPYSKAITQIVRSGVLGELINVVQVVLPVFTKNIVCFSHLGISGISPTKPLTV